MWTKETHWKHDVLAYHRKYEKEKKKVLDKRRYAWYYIGAVCERHKRESG